MMRGKILCIAPDDFADEAIRREARRENGDVYPLYYDRHLGYGGADIDGEIDDKERFESAMCDLAANVRRENAPVLVVGGLGKIPLLSSIELANFILDNTEVKTVLVVFARERGFIYKTKMFQFYRGGFAIPFVGERLHYVSFWPEIIQIARFHRDHPAAEQTAP